LADFRWRICSFIFADQLARRSVTQQSENTAPNFTGPGMFQNTGFQNYTGPRKSTLDLPVAGNVLGSGRIECLDGLRGAAALVVVLFHYLCLLHPKLTPSMSEAPRALVDTPLNLAVNGVFAVALFFVLSGLVIAGTADRRRNSLTLTLAARYLRLAVPAAASCVLAWILLSLMPTGALSLATYVDTPSRWLNYTYQGDLASPLRAMYNGMIGIFHHGFSRWNNVLWTMKIELFGSAAIYVLYALKPGQLRLGLLVAGTLIVPPLTEPSYIAFGLGALLYEGSRHLTLQQAMAWLGRARPFVLAVILGTGLMLAFPGQGFHVRAGLPLVPADWRIGEERGYVHVFAATLLILGVLLSPTVARPFTLRPLLWLGRVSFALYLVHVPVLYTLVPTLYLTSAIASPILLLWFVIFCLFLAELFTRFVDVPALWLSRRVRKLNSYRRVPC
jgi:peptidoglycan/LPS O-acetylase OafA/YrhL